MDTAKEEELDSGTPHKVHPNIDIMDTAKEEELDSGTPHKGHPNIDIMDTTKGRSLTAEPLMKAIPIFKETISIKDTT